MDADNDEVIIKRKMRYIAGGLDDVHTAGSRILSALLRNVRYILAGLSK